MIRCMRTLTIQVTQFCSKSVQTKKMQQGIASFLYHAYYKSLSFCIATQLCDSNTDWLDNFCIANDGIIEIKKGDWTKDVLSVNSDTQKELF